MKETLVFIHGWPDDSSLWDHQVKHLEERYNCVCLTLPGFAPDEASEVKMDFPDLVNFIVSELKKLNTPLTIICHDWGAYLTYIVEQKHPELVKSIVGLDVGGHMFPRNPKEALMIFSYQTWLASAWLGRKSFPELANRMTRGFANLARAPHLENVDARMNYIYYFVFRDLLNPFYHKHLLQDYKPKCPVMFLYGESKPMMFHSKKWEKMVTEIHGIPKGGHWFMVQKPELTNRLIDNWLARYPHE